MGILFLTTVLPGGRRTGGEIVSDSIVEALTAAGHQVTVLGYRRPGDHAPNRGGEVCVGRRPIETASARPRAIAWMAGALATATPYSVTKYRSGPYLRAARTALSESPAVVIVDHAQMQFSVSGFGGSLPPLIFIAHNVEEDLYARLAAEAGGQSGRWLYSREARLVSAVEFGLAHRAEQVWTLTQDDAEHFRSLHRAADVRILAVTSRLEAHDRAPAPTYDIGLMGTWTWRANARGLEWFSSEIVPGLPAGTTIEVAGAGADWLRGRHPNLVIRGVVPDAQRFLSRARVIAVPAVTGGGIQVKTVDAIASGVPLVGTPFAVRGLADLPASVVVAENPAEFVAGLNRFVAEPERDRLRAEAIAWSMARRLRLETDVACWVDELTTGER